MVSHTKSRKMPTGNILPLCFVIRAESEWVAELLFGPLLGWNQWVWDRRTAEGSLGASATASCAFMNRVMNGLHS